MVRMQEKIKKKKKKHVIYDEIVISRCEKKYSLRKIQIR